MTGPNSNADPEPDRIDALLDAYALKDERRTGWQLREVSDPESVASHSWGVAYLCLCFADDVPDVDPDEALRLAVLHDVAEARTGDKPTRADPDAETVDPDEKEQRERAAVSELLAPFDAHLRDDWEAYESRDTPTAQFVKDMDLVDMCLQAVIYEREARYDPDTDNPNFEAYGRLDEFFATAEPRLRTDLGRRLFEALQRRYETAKRERDDASE
ncbi:HD family hydrolase [Halogeometricum borinquense]|uniref:5'-deoxynucleotidase n=1 Tax=Halogeometricum borinquense TaxID=60847 RepID=A0A6C0UFJ1_9EURY|nr:HD family hydrolase [Halogeometricum borinquense]QIB73323.1 HD family hydrolase [Halogeometricum borinquense]QIQ77280.1 HD family hydrolase [Halogeometricum borinquense]